MVNVASERSHWRQRGYFDGLAGRPRSTTVPEEHRPAYLGGYRRGKESRARMMD